ncbi:uncharacterized protein LOC121601562 isoform X2 [Anopheles merus]|uniref:uncharacterized protein LOC121601562 isoform X2 n=1 Tax=Anopheles merus TaxID=30066 RepID=UPI001BE3D2A6|nr:uncharacterized protein LOC121601562 isoform X2 [Anopheles merus]
MEASCMSSLETSKRTGQFYRRLQKRTAEEEVLEEEEYSRSGVENDLSHTNGDISKNGAAFFLPTEIDVNCFISNGCTLFIKGKPISKPGSGFKEEYTSDADNVCLMLMMIEKARRKMISRKHRAHFVLSAALLPRTITEPAEEGAIV